MQVNTFPRFVARMRRVLPAFAFALLVLTYLVAALVGGLFLSQHLARFGAFGVVLAFGIGLAVQAVRGGVVFLPELNSDRPSSGFSTSKVVAVVMGGLSIFEVYKLTASIGLDPSVFVSLALLMGAGVVIELGVLSEIVTARNMDFFSDPAKRAALIDAHRAQAEYERFLDELSEEMASPRPAPMPGKQMPAPALGNGIPVPTPNGNGKHP